MVDRVDRPSRHPWPFAPPGCRLGAYLPIGGAMAVSHAGMPKRSGIFQVTATLGALGVVYGDIGTSPLYALREAARAAAHGGTVTPDAVLGIVSLILWALILIISIKY